MGDGEGAGGLTRLVIPGMNNFIIAFAGPKFLLGLSTLLFSLVTPAFPHSDQFSFIQPLSALN